ncbi:MAG TPA: trypsin-like peptidase domain-containing protein [Thermoleophilaceae bacterium]|nr:trypsin-like peptidase domain-containing protein [Thermoleophilaceae bacterium]
MTANRTNFLSGLLGGIVVLVIGAVLIATGVINSGGSTKTIVRQSPLAVPSSNATDSPNSGLTVEEIYNRDGPGVAFVQAKITQQVASPFGFPSVQQGVSTGSGFVIDKKGDIITNSHVVNGASDITVRLGNGPEIKATLVGKDVSTDLALLRINPSATKLHPLTLGDSSKVRVGDPAVAIGNPFGFDRTVTSGIVSALQRQIDAPNNFTIDNVIQTDAAINPGNSGGPLINAKGQVIGINSQIATGGNGDGNVGIGFAIPINTVKAAIPQLEKNGKVLHAYLGVSTAQLSPQDARDLNLPSDKGALVQQVMPGSPAAKAGLRAGNTQTSTGLVIGGDLIVKVDGKQIAKPDDVAAVVSGHKPGDKVQVQFYRDGKLKTVTVTLGNRPAGANAQPQQQQQPGGGGGQQLPGFPFP